MGPKRTGWLIEALLCVELAERSTHHLKANLLIGEKGKLIGTDARRSSRRYEAF
ncbi:hypothetical protein [Rufibacter sp. XAAS-G3-1]|uniref:hypothetical protein n=1 Tax=Rufibacter sp. XAAS-G3-1 TaxID=2729134 RepID=UPI0015E78373|nr:hypothetical protein [Rufibacter sp. XAAS-G3-1]